MTKRNITRLSQKQFSAQALEYSKSQTFTAGADLDIVVSMANDVQANIAIDIGSGAGFTAFAVSPFASTVLSTDLVLPMLQHAVEGATARGLTNIAPALVSAESLPFANDSIGLLTCRLAAHHFSDVTVGVSEWARVIEPGGTLILVDTVTPENPDVATWMNEVELQRDPSHSRDLSGQEWILTKIPLEFDDWMRRAGASPETTESVRSKYLNATGEVAAAFGIQIDETLHFFWPCLALKART